MRALLTAGPLILAGALAAQVAPSIDAAFQKFWQADSRESAAKAADQISRTRVSFDEAWRRLRAGRAYKAKPSGVVQLKNRTANGVEHYYAVTVPPGYDPARKYQVRFQLHGGVGGRTGNKPRGSGEVGALAGAEQFYVIPYSWDESPWWSDDQVGNLSAIVDALKREYNIDENRVVVAGVSDGGTGAYYIAMRDTTPYASFLPLNGFIMVLGNSEIDDGRIFPNNLLNKPMFVINGGRDRLYPTSAVEPYTRHLMAGGVQIEYHPQPDGEHNTRWWPEMKDPFEKFVAAHPRDPYPDKLTWQASAQHRRAHWLVIEKFGNTINDSRGLADLNNMEGGMFRPSSGSGRVDLSRSGNTVQAATKGVSAFTLLLSPDEFDFDKPVRVIANGREVFFGKVQRDLKTLLKWAAQDNDRTMLFAAEIPVTLPR